MNIPVAENFSKPPNTVVHSKKETNVDQKQHQIKDLEAKLHKRDITDRIRQPISTRGSTTRKSIFDFSIFRFSIFQYSLIL